MAHLKGLMFGRYWPDSRGGCVVLAATLLGCSRAKVEPPPPLPTVRTTVVSASAEPPLTLRGPVVAGSRLRLGFKAPGVVKVILVKDGDTVRKGQLLARLDAADATAHARAAQVIRDRAKREWQRSVKLVDEGALASSTRDDAKSELDGAEASVAVAWEALKSTQLTSPVMGTVFKRMAEPGETVASGAPVLIVDETQRPVVKLGVTDRDLKRLRKNQNATLRIVQIRHQAANRERIRAVIIAMAPTRPATTIANS